MPSLAEAELEEREKIEELRDRYFMRVVMQCFGEAHVKHGIVNPAAFDVSISAAVGNLVHATMRATVVHHFRHVFPFGIAGTKLTPHTVTTLARFFAQLNSFVDDGDFTTLYYPALPAFRLQREMIPPVLYHVWFGLMAVKAACVTAAALIAQAGRAAGGVYDLRDSVVALAYGRRLDTFSDDELRGPPSPPPEGVSESPAEKSRWERAREEAATLRHAMIRLQFATKTAWALAESDHVGGAIDGKLEDEFYQFCLQVERQHIVTFADPDNTIRIEYQRGPVCGKGANGTVYRCLDTADGSFLALKVLPLPAETDSVAEQAIRVEIDTLQRLHHPNVVAFHGCKFDRDSHEVQILMEYAPKSLRDIAKEHGGLSMGLIAHFGRKALLGLQHLHEKQLLHRDVKAANILVTDTGEVKVSDFGSAVHQGGDVDADDELASAAAGGPAPAEIARRRGLRPRRGLVGTPLFVAPEVLRGALPTEAADIWSFGCMLIELVTGTKGLWANLTADSPPLPLLLRRLTAAATHPPLPTDGVDASFTALLQRIFVMAPEQRPSAKDLLKADFFTSLRGSGGASSPLSEKASLVSYPSEVALLLHTQREEHADRTESGVDGVAEAKVATVDVYGSTMMTMTLVEEDGDDSGSDDGDGAVVRSAAPPLPPRLGSTLPGEPSIRDTTAPETANSLFPIIDKPESPGRRRRRKIHDSIVKHGYQTIKVLGKGATGTVYAAVLKNGVMIAVKEVDVLDTSEALAALAATKAEVELLEQLDHPNVVQTFFFDDSRRETEARVAICMELVAGGTLANLAAGLSEPLREDIVKVYTQQLVAALAYVHSRSMVHRDIKGANVLVTQEGKLKLSDFGAAKQLSNNPGAGAATLIGTPLYMAPELLKGTLMDDASGTGTVSLEDRQKADVWSLGITVLEMMNRGDVPWPPFDNVIEAFTHIADDGLGHPIVPDHVSLRARSFLELCFKRNPAERATAAQLQEHPWLARSGVNLRGGAIPP